MRARFLSEFRFTSRTRNAGWHVQPHDDARPYPRELIEAAVAAGAAEIVAPAKPRSRTAPRPDKTGE